MNDLSAAILTGGKSRRMGEPKAILRLTAEDPTLIERVGTVAYDIAKDVFLVGLPGWPLPDTFGDIRIVADGGRGAADGLIAALENALHDFCVVTACDMPFLDAELLRVMTEVARTRGRSVLASDPTGLHPLHAVYRRTDLTRIREIVFSGQRSLIRICTGIGAITFDTGECERWRWSVFNVNTPDDLHRARQYVSSRKES